MHNPQRLFGAAERKGAERPAVARLLGRGGFTPARSSGLLGGDVLRNFRIERLEVLRPVLRHWHSTQDALSKAGGLNVTAPGQVYAPGGKSPRRSELTEPVFELCAGRVRPHAAAKLAVRNEAAAWPRA